MRIEFLHLDERGREAGFGFTWTSEIALELGPLLQELRLAGVEAIAVSEPGPAQIARFERAAAAIREGGLRVLRFSREAGAWGSSLRLNSDEGAAGQVLLVDREIVRARHLEAWDAWFSPWPSRSEDQLEPERLLRWIFRREAELSGRKRYLVHPHPVLEAREAAMLSLPEIQTWGDHSRPCSASFVIPVRPSAPWLEIFPRFLRRVPPGAGCEVIIVANLEKNAPRVSSYPGLARLFENSAVPVRWIGVAAQASRFVAGAARNLGLSQARGRIVACIDGDTVPTGEWFRDILRRHQKPGIVSLSRRWNVRVRQDGALEKDPDSMERYWRVFNERAAEFLARDDGWKYVCSHSLALHRDDWSRLGGFAWPFQTYGYEDTDFAYRAKKAGLRFEISGGESLHFDERPERESLSRRKALLKRSAEIFLRTHVDPEVAHHCHYLFRTSRLWQVSDRLRELLP